MLAKVLVGGHISKPTCCKPSCNEGKAKRCKLDDLALVVVELCAPPLRAEPAGELGSEAILYWMGRKGGLGERTLPATARLGLAGATTVKRGGAT